MPSLRAPELQPFPHDTIPKLFFAAIDRGGEHPALLYEAAAGDWRSLSYGEVLERVQQTAAGLDALGYEPGDRIAILSDNRPEWAIADHAALGMGLIDVPIYTTLPPNQIAHVLSDSGAKGIFVSDADQLQKIAEIRDDVPALQHIFIFDADHAGQATPFADLLTRGADRLASGEASDYRQRAMGVAPDDLATLIYTSGTTGDPKGVMLTHHNIASNVAAVHQHELFSVSPGDIALSFLPLSHSFERMADYFYWSGGVTIAYAAIDRVADAMLAVRPHVLAAAPRVFEKIFTKVMGATGLRRALILWAKKVGEAAIEDRLAGRGPSGVREKLADRLVFAKIRERTGGRIRMFASGSAPLSSDIARFFWAAGLPIFEGYGLTETSPVLTVNRPGEVELGSVGPPIPGTEIRLSESGEILARGPQIMKGYWNRPEETREVIDDDGWLHTGDIGVIERGKLRITDRLKNILVTAGGKNIAPAPIENQASLSPYVAQVMMVADKRPFPALLVIPDFENLRAWAASQNIRVADDAQLASDPRVRTLLETETIGSLDGFARYETPKKIAIIPEEFSIETGELTATMKVKRRIVEERYADLIEEIYAE